MESFTLPLVFILVFASTIVTGVPNPQESCIFRDKNVCNLASENDFVLLGTSSTTTTARSVYFRSTAIVSLPNVVCLYTLQFLKISFGNERKLTIYICQLKIYFSKTQWQGAISDCRRIFGASSTLANIETQEEFVKLTEFMKDETSGTVYWTGGRYDSVQKTFIWQNNSPIGSWLPWDVGHPDSAFSITRIVYSPISARFQTFDNSNEHR